MAGLVIAAAVLSAAGAARAAKEKPPLIVELEKATGLELTFAQRERIADLSQEHAAEVRALHAAFLADLSKAVGLSQKILREAVFPEMSPSFEVGEARRETIERQIDGYLSYAQKRSIDRIVKRWQEERVQAREAYARAVGSVTDIPVEEVIGFLNTNE